MSIFVKIFLAVSISTIISISFFVNYIINIQKQEAIDRLNNKIEYHKSINKNVTSQLLFDLNKEILTTNLNSLYLDQDIKKIELIDYSNVINLSLDTKDYEGELTISNILLQIDGEALGELNIFYSKEFIQKNIDNYKENIIELSFFLVLLLLAIIFYFIKKSIVSIQKLTFATKQITSGNLDFHIDVKTNDEIGMLSNKFDEMRTSLKNRLHIINQQLKFQQSLIQSVNIPIYIKDINGKYVDCNDAYAAFYGKHREEIIGKDMTFLIKGGYSNIYSKMDKELFQTGGNTTFETKLPNHKNELKDIILYKNIFDDESTNLKWMIGTYFDITEINKAKEKIEKFNEELQVKVFERTEELEEANEELQITIDNLKQTQNQLIESEKLASLGSLVAGVAHEINTPVGIGLTGITHLLEETRSIIKLYEKDEMSQEDFEHYLKVSEEISNLVNTNLTRTAQLVKSFKQISVDQTSEEIREFNLKEYIEEILFSLSNITKKTKIKINVVGESNIKINSYPGALSQIITNLIINSLRHAYNKDEEGEININFKQVDGYIHLEYTDDGRGIKKDYLNKIFDPFFTTNRKAGNTGLGLNIIYNIVTKTLNGSVTCESKETEGVKFVIEFKQNI